MNAMIHRGAILSALLVGLPALAEPMTVTLNLRPKVTMQQLANNVLNPASSHFNRPYEPAEIRAVAGPTDAEYTDLLSGLKAEGLQVTYESPTHLWVSVRGDKAIFESLFDTKIQALGHHQFKHMTATHVPFQLNLVQSVTGFDTSRKMHPKIVRTHVKQRDDNGNLGISPATIKTTYGFDPIYKSGLSGKGQQIAIATYNDFVLDNVNQYYKLIGLTTTPTVDKVPFNGTPNYDVDSAGETELDSEFSGMMAPGASIHVFTSADNSDNGELQMFTAIMDDNRAKLVNYSWGSCEDQLTTQHQTDMETVFQRAIAQGVNIFIASGDTGSKCQNDGTTNADWPAASPNVTGVGGITLDLTGSTPVQTGWSGSGGGISSVFALPTWQQGIGAQYSKRSFPDVSFNADPDSGEAIYTGPQGDASWEVIGGTSMASPQWVGFMALVGEARANANKAQIGYFAPIPYQMSAADRANTFTDITSGSNGDYNCGPGWDAVTGWGSMQANALLTYLVAQ